MMLSGGGEWESQETLNDQVTCEEKPEEMMEEGEEPRWPRSRMGRTLFPPQIHQKSI